MTFPLIDPSQNDIPPPPDVEPIDNPPPDHQPFPMPPDPAEQDPRDPGNMPVPEDVPPPPM